jgi:putative thioredoxin
LLDGLGPLAREDDRAKALTARLNIASGSAGAPPAAALEARLAADADDLEARLQLANVYAAQQRYEAALAQLLEIVRRGRDARADAARQQMIALFSLLGSGDELVRRYRRLLAAELH